MKKLKRVGVDIAKTVFHVHGVDADDQLQGRTKLSRNEWIEAVCEAWSRPGMRFVAVVVGPLRRPSSPKGATLRHHSV